MKLIGDVTFSFTEDELDIIIDALWEYQHVLSHSRPKARHAVQLVRKRLVLESTQQLYGQGTAWAMAALPPEST